MRVSDLMIPTGPMTSATTLRDAAIGMHASGVDALPVTDGRGQVGLLTADAVAFAAAGGRCDPARTSARGAMAQDCCRVHADDDLDAAIRAMTSRRARRSVVLDRGNHPVGILALGDCAAESGPAPSGRGPSGRGPSGRGPSGRGAIERVLDGDRIEGNWRRLGAGRRRHRRPAGTAYPRSAAAPGSAADGPAASGSGDRSASRGRASPGAPLPLDAFVEAYLDYHG